MTIITFNPTYDNKIYIIGILTLISIIILYLNAIIYKFYLLHLRIYIHSRPESISLQLDYDKKTTKFLPLNESEKDLLNEIEVPKTINFMRIINFFFLCYIIGYSLYTSNYSVVGLNNLIFPYIFNFLMEFPKGFWASYYIKVAMILTFMLISSLNILSIGLFMINNFFSNKSELIYFEYNPFLISTEIVFIIIMIALTILNSEQSEKYLENKSKLGKNNKYGAA